MRSRARKRQVRSKTKRSPKRSRVQRSRQKSSSRWQQTLRSISFDLVDPRVQRKVYDDGAEEYHSKHLGQHKLFLTLLYFMIHYGHLSHTVVYAGSAPGSNIFIISEMFPRHRFVLYDTAPFDKRLLSRPNVKVYHQLFLKEDAEKWKHKGILFLSDIRNPRIGQVNKEETQEQQDIVNEDMNLQSEWIRAMRPAMSMLKFRLRWDHNTTFYWDGDVMIQPYAPLRSSETRLITPGLHERYYPNQDYDERISWHNDVRRNEYRYPTLPHVVPLWDVAAQVKIIYDYFTIIKKIKPTPKMMYLEMKRISVLLRQKNPLLRL